MNSQAQQNQSQNTYPLSDIILPSTYNYIGVFLTLACNLNCSYCINTHNGLTRKDLLSNEDKTKQKQKVLTPSEWIQGLSRIQTREDLPITFQGGEPTISSSFYPIVKGINKHMDLLTNGLFDLDEFRDKVLPSKFKRKAKYASIRISYHPEQMDLYRTASRAQYLQELGYQVGVWSVLTPANEQHLFNEAEQVFKEHQIDFRYKEMLGEWNGEIKGTFKYPDSVESKTLKQCECRTTELLIGPNGNVYKCHSDLYAKREAIGHILQKDFHLDNAFRHCSNYGSCSACDVKIKTNRHQEYGHTSVEIINVR